MKKVRLPYQWVLHFFGLTPSNKDLYLDQVFLLIYHLGFSYSDAYKCPVWQRSWFINRLKAEFDEAKKSNNAPNRAKGQTRGSKSFTRSFM